MSFLSFEFVLFLVALWILYYAFPKKYQWLILLIANMIFIEWNMPYSGIYLSITIVSVFCSAHLIGKMNERLRNAKLNLDKEEYKCRKKKVKGKQKLIMVFAILVNLSFLIFFKYINNIISGINAVIALQGDQELETLDFLVPLGLSYYTFMSIGYLIDIYRGKYLPEKNIFRYSLFVSYFPQLLQGPIGRYDLMSEQFREEHKFNYNQFTYGLQAILWGLLKKIVIADRISVVTKTIFDNYGDYQGLYMWIGMFLYSVQVYCDFSGGIDMALGVSETLGITLTPNFKRPFLAISVADYWRRWHISLNEWLRDYVFYPISLSKTFAKIGKISRKVLGNRAGKFFAIYIATFVVRIINAIWHGGSAKYFLNGVYNGILVIMGIQCEPIFIKISDKLNINKESRLWKFFCMARTFLLIGFGKILVRSDNIGDGLIMIKSMFTVYNPWILFDDSLYKLGLSMKNYQVMILFIFMLFIVECLQEKGIGIRDTISRQKLVVRWAIYYAAIFIIIIFGMYGPGYNASDFIYMQF